ncbi:hypothetical protein O3G_MSEX003583 [Manduca sexta]|uniref:Craniofacial development protein 1 n=1 Tax=Manduca sexta TaxID=7130 RepID=A0A921YST0_MANSE|nr:hypothetical protein O3G_MSEX003583 [Manduca sexta]
MGKMSSGSESDEDYVPKEPEQLSEEESADDETEKQYDAEVENNKKRKAIQEGKGKKKLKKAKVTRTKPDPEPIEEDDRETEVKLNPEEEKKREEDLWAKFLEGTDSKPKAKESNIPKDPIKTVVKEEKPQTSTKHNDDLKEKERRIFEFAGETIIVENNVIKEKMKKSDTPGDSNKEDGPSQVSISNKSAGKSGLSNILGNLNKKNKLSTLEKSKLDWTTYKQEEGIEEEIQSHNKGKQGYLERRDFLERADLRQYEIERDLRMNRRSNR